MLVGGTNLYFIMAHIYNGTHTSFKLLLIFKGLRECLAHTEMCYQKNCYTTQQNSLSNQAATHSAFSSSKRNFKAYSK